jgi:hypothetical protein
VKGFLLGLVFLAGVLIGYLIPVFPHLFVNPSVDFGEVLNAIVLLLVAIGINYVYTEQSGAKRSDTELLLYTVRDARSAFDALRLAALACERNQGLTNEEQLEIVVAKRELFNSIESIEQGLMQCRIKSQDMGFQRLKDACLLLMDALTDSPYPGPYDNASLSAIGRYSKLVRNELNRVAFAINHR